MQQHRRLSGDLNAEIARQKRLPGGASAPTSPRSPTASSRPLSARPASSASTVTPRRVAVEPTLRHARAARRWSGKPAAFRFLALLGLIVSLASRRSRRPCRRRPVGHRDVIHPRSMPSAATTAPAPSAHASPSIRGNVRHGRGLQWTWSGRATSRSTPPKVFDFREIVTLHGQVTQKVHVVGPTGAR